MQYKRTKADGTLVKDWTNITDTDYQTFRVPGEEETISADNRNDTGRSLEDTLYYYNVADKVKQTTSDEKKMSDIISNGTGSSYDVSQWLASRCVSFDFRGAYFYVRSVTSGVGYWPSFNSYGDSYSNYNRVRPVVSLESNIQLSGNSNDGWTIE